MILLSEPLCEDCISTLVPSGYTGMHYQ